MINLVNWRAQQNRRLYKRIFFIHLMLLTMAIGLILYWQTQLSQEIHETKKILATASLKKAKTNNKTVHVLLNKTQCIIHNTPNTILLTKLTFNKTHVIINGYAIRQAHIELFQKKMNACPCLKNINVQSLTPNKNHTQYQFILRK